MASNLVQSLPPFDPDTEIGASVAPKWKAWLEDFEMFLVANGITNATQKRALLLYQERHRVREIIRQLPNIGDAAAYQTAVDKLEEHFEPQRYKLYEIYKFRKTKPVVQQQRRIPFHLRSKVQNELAKLAAQDIIEKVPLNEETDWVSLIVCVPKKNGEIRLCVDMRAANNAIKRVRHPIPTVKDISIDLNGTTGFSKLDLSSA